MSTNCKPGDLAIVTKGSNMGKIVQCLYTVDPKTIKLGRVRAKKNLIWWRVDRDMETPEWPAPYIPDRVLCPLRGIGDEDEILVREEKHEKA